MMPVEEGKLSLDDPPHKFFPNAPAAWKEVRVRHLLSPPADSPTTRKDFDFRRDYTEDELLKSSKASRSPSRSDQS